MRKPTKPMQNLDARRCFFDGYVWHCTDKCHKQKEATVMVASLSGYQDSNLGPPVPKTGALPDCATSRNRREKIYLLPSINCGGSGIRTRGTGYTRTSV